MNTLFIGIQGYEIAGDKYDVLLPAVTSWTLERRKKASKKNNFSGGFSASTNKNDEYRYYSITWSELAENDYSTEGTSIDLYKLVAQIPNRAIITPTGNAIYITPIKFNIPKDTIMYIKKITGEYIQLIVVSDYKANTNMISVKATVATSVLTSDTLIMHKLPGYGLLSLASLAATGNTHMMRDFLGNLVKVIFQSPKYNALSGTDEYHQIYYDVTLDFDLVADTLSQNYKSTKGLQVNVSNETLPKVSTIATSSGNFSISSFFVKDGNLFNVIRLSTAKANTPINISTIKPIAPYYVQSNASQLPLRNMANKIGIFKNYISTNTQLNVQFKNSTYTARSDNTTNDVEFVLNSDETLYVGAWTPTTNYGNYDAWTTGSVYPIGEIRTSNNRLYASLKDNNNAPLTDTTAWLILPSGIKILVSYTNKIYYLKTPTSKNNTPAPATANWDIYTPTPSSLTMKILPSIANTLTNDDSLIIAIQPYTFQDSDGNPNVSSVLLKVPIIDGVLLQDLDFNDTGNLVKLANMYPIEDNALNVNYLGNSYKATNTGSSNFKYYENSQLASSVLGLPISTTGNQAWNMSIEYYRAKYNIETVKNKLVNYMIVDIPTGGSVDTTISDGIYTYTINQSKVPNSVRIQFSKDYIPRFLISNVSITSSIDTPTIIKSFTLLNFSQTLVESIYDPVASTLTTNTYWLTLDPAYANNIKIVNDTVDNTKVDTTKSGLAVIKHYRSSVSTVTASIDSQNTIISSFSQPSSPQYVNLASINTYDMNPISEQFIVRFFNLEDPSWYTKA